MTCSGWVESIGVANKNAVFAMLVGLAKQFDILVLVLRIYPQYLCSRVKIRKGRDYLMRYVFGEKLDFPPCARD